MPECGAPRGPNLAAAEFVQAEIALAENNRQEAEQRLNRVVEVGAPAFQQRAYLRLSHLRAKLGDRRTAIEYALKALDASELNASLLKQVCARLLDSDAAEEVGVILTQYGHLLNSEELQVLSARRLMKLGRQAEAESLLRPVLDDNAESFEARSLLATLLMQRKAAREAFRLLQDGPDRDSMPSLRRQLQVGNVAELDVEELLPSAVNSAN
jgi:tetratricopeptide (TPR) repeat protein